MSLGKLPLSPSGIRASATIDSNLGDSAVQQRAQQALAFGQKWITALGRLADMTHVNLGDALSFARTDVRRLTQDLNHDKPDARISRDTNRLLNDWGTQGPQVFQTIRHSLFGKAEQQITNLLPDLARAGVTSPQVQGAVRDFAAALGQIDALMSRSPLPGPITPGGGVFGQFQIVLNRAMQNLAQAMQADVMAHPEHQQVLNAVGARVTTSVRELEQGLNITTSLMMSLQHELMGMGGLPRQPPAFPPGGPILDQQPRAA